MGQFKNLANTFEKRRVEIPEGLALSSESLTKFGYDYEIHLQFPLQKKRDVLFVCDLSSEDLVSTIQELMEAPEKICRAVGVLSSIGFSLFFFLIKFFF